MAQETAVKEKPEKAAKKKVINLMDTIMEGEDAAVFIDFEKRDENQIRDEILGNTVLDFFYQFQQGSRTITGLSLRGINELARKMGNIWVDEPKIKDKGEHYEVMVRVKDVLRNIVTWGISTQKKKMKIRDGGEMDDDFALQKAFSKARRNALRQLLPESLITQALAKWKEERDKNRQDSKTFMPDRPQQ